MKNKIFTTIPKYGRERIFGTETEFGISLDLDNKRKPVRFCVPNLIQTSSRIIFPGDIIYTTKKWKSPMEHMKTILLKVIVRI